MFTTANLSCITSALALLLVLYQLCRRILPWIYKNFIGPTIIGSKIKFCDYGEWAVITGATDGIGKAYARELASKGLKLVLISRSKQKLDSVALEIQKDHKTEVRCIEIDFTHDRKIYDSIAEVLAGLDIAVLVNNVGVSYRYPDYFMDCYAKQREMLYNIITANIYSVTEMCGLVLPGMVSKRKGIIINLSSIVATIPNPLLTVYSATKAYVDKFSADLKTEVETHGIIVQSVQPGFVATNMTKLRKATTFAPNAQTFVKSALSTLDYAAHTAGYLPHALFQTGVHLAEDLLGGRIVKGLIMNNLLKMRSGALRKLEKKN